MDINLKNEGKEYKKKDGKEKEIEKQINEGMKRLVHAHMHAHTFLTQIACCTVQACLQNTGRKAVS